MEDHVLPIKGGWIMTKDVPPCYSGTGNVIQPMPLSIFWAMPDKVSVYGSYRHSGVFYRNIRDRDLRPVWKQRRGAKLDEMETDAVEAIERKFEQEYQEPLILEMRVRIRTHQGDMNLNPNEWTRVRDIEPYLRECDGEQFRLVELGGMKGSRKIKDQMFYARSRGLDRAAAFQMIAGSIERPGVFFIEPHPELAEYFGYNTKGISRAI